LLRMENKKVSKTAKELVLVQLLTKPPSRRIIYSEGPLSSILVKKTLRKIKSA
jgi:hypothetical protein